MFITYHHQRILTVDSFNPIQLLTDVLIERLKNHLTQPVASVTACKPGWLTGEVHPPPLEGRGRNKKPLIGCRGHNLEGQKSMGASLVLSLFSVTDNVFVKILDSPCRVSRPVAAPCLTSQHEELALVIRISGNADGAFVIQFPNDHCKGDSRKLPCTYRT